MATSQKAKGPAEAATSPDHGSTNPEKDKEMNSTDNNTIGRSAASISRRAALASIPAMGAAAIVPAMASPVAAECPDDKMRRLSKELSAALDHVDYCTLAMIYPASQHDFPVLHIHDREYARVSKAMLEYRDACRAAVGAKGKNGNRLVAECDRAHERLLVSFFEDRP